MDTLSPALMASTSEVLVAAASTWMGYLTRLASAEQQASSLSQLGGRGAASEPSGQPAAGFCPVPPPTPAEVTSLVSCGLGPALVATVRQQLQATLESRAVPAFWAEMSRCRAAAAAGDDDSLEHYLLGGLQGLCAVVDGHCAALQQLAAMVTAALLQGCSTSAASPHATSTLCTQPSPLPPTVAATAAALYGEQALALVPVVMQLTDQYRTAVSALLMSTAEMSISELLLLYYSSKLTQLAQTLAPLEQLLEAQEDGAPAATAAAAGGGGAAATAAGAVPDPTGGGRGNGGGPLAAPLAATGFGALALSGGGGAGVGDPRVSDGGGMMGSAAAVEDGVAMLMGSAAGGGDDAENENTSPPSNRRKALQPSAVAAAMGSSWVRRLVGVCSCLSRLSLGTAGEGAVVAAVSHHVERLLRRLAFNVFDREVLPAANRAANRIPLEFLRLVIAGDGGGSSITATPAAAAACAAPDSSNNAAAAPVAAATTNAAAAAATATGSQAAAAAQPSSTPAAGEGGGGGLAEPGTEARTLTEWRLRLSYLVYETLGRRRIAQMFDIVVDYPDSLPAIRDLAACLRHTNLQALFVRSFKRALQQRLLHAGASATGIIHQYVATIRTMREIDPSGSLLRAVAQPIRDYLRGRSDTIKCLVSMVTQDGGGPNGESLLEELQAAAAASGAAATAAMDVDSASEDVDEKVLRIATATATAGFPGLGPPPAGVPSCGGGAAAATAAAAPPGAGGGGAAAAVAAAAAGSSAADVVSMLTGVFGSPEVFINEYRNLLCGQLLYRSDYDTVREVRTLELLKMRFGENALHACEGMLKDIADSKRINHRVHSMSLPIGSTPPQPASPIGSAVAVAAAATAAAAAAAAAAAVSRATPGGRTTRQSHQRAAAAAVGAAGNTPQVQTRAATAAAQQQQAAAAAAARAAASGKPAEPPSKPSCPEFDLLSAVLISYLLWPRQEDRDKGAPDDPATGLVLPAAIRSAMETYEQRYHHLKTPRRLRWRPHLGCVDLDVSAGGVTASFTVSPLMATLLLAFKDRPAMSAGELAAAVGLPPALVRRKMLFWVNHGIIVEGRAQRPSGAGAGGSGVPFNGGATGTGSAQAMGDSHQQQQQLVYRRAEALPAELLGAKLTDYGAEDEAPAQLPSAADHAVEEVGPFENYIKGMLQNYGGLPLDRLNHMLRLFVVSTPKYDKTPEQLQAFLQVLIARQVVVLDNNSIYRLASAAPAAQRATGRRGQVG